MFLKLELQENEETRDRLPAFARYLIAGIIAALSAMLIFALLNTDKAAPDIAALAAEKLSLSGVENPVTAVLLNFRSYDTLLEIAVLLIVTVAILPSQQSALYTPTQSDRSRFLVTNKQAIVNPVLAGLLKWLVPLSILTGGYLLWTGAYKPGGAFQAGAIIAGAGVALSLAGRHHFIWESTRVRFSLCLGLWVFVLVAAANAMVTGTTLQYPIPYAGILILVVEIAATVSIAAALLLLFDRLKTMAMSPVENIKVVEGQEP